MLKAFFEQALRPGFAIGKAGHGRMPPKLLRGKSTLIGMVATEKAKDREQWLDKLAAYGRKAS